MTVPGFTQIFYLNPQNLQIWQFVTSIFLHGSLMHIFFNAYSLFLFGPLLERKMGQKNFLIIFFLSGIAGNVLYELTTVAGIIAPIPSLGASGAIFGILGALVVAEPALVLLLFGIIPMKIRDAAILWFVLEFFGSFNTSSGIASAAHLGGLVVGYALAKYWLKPKQETDKYQWMQYRGQY
ncbi:MAG: rhomboid family intramembrane serine protease [Candidatus Micrarchaeia archaeon]